MNNFDGYIWFPDDWEIKRAFSNMKFENTQFFKKKCIELIRAGKERALYDWVKKNHPQMLDILEKLLILK